MNGGRVTKSLVLALAFLAGAILPSVFGCSAEYPLRHVVEVFSDGHLALDTQARQQLQRFGTTYRTYAEPDDPRWLKHFSDAYKRVRANYVRDLDDAALIDSAIKGVKQMDPPPKPDSAKPKAVIEAALTAMVGDLDPHSQYLTAEEYREMGVTTKGEFGGLGIEVTMEEGYVKVVAPIEDTPAARAGIKAGDLVTGLDGESIKGITLHQAVTRMRGEPGTDITLTVRRKGRAPFDVTITRAIIEVKAVRWRRYGDIGYVRVTRFNGKAEEGIETALDALRAGGGLRGVVLDLRNNPGGLLDQSVEVADAFLNDGRIVTVRGPSGREERAYNAGSGDLARGLPVVVLINGGSASASEIVAAALQDHRRAQVMGRTSFGKGSVQTVLPLPEEGGLRLTTQLYYTPMERLIQARGVQPDIRILDDTPEDEREERRREADLPGALPGSTRVVDRTRARVHENDCPTTEVKAEDEPDRMLGCALEFLRAGSLESFLRRVPAAGEG